MKLKPTCRTGRVFRFGASIESNLQEELLGYTNYKSKFYGFWR
nr:MAG TPA: hypothetical protein [Caudoviricetes sp.]